MPEPIVTACLLIIGNEILSGRTQDANLAFLGEKLNEAGVRLREARVIPDDEAVIVDTVNQVRGRFDYVFTTGGIGPTHDDITAECVAKAFGVPLIRNPEAVAILKAFYPPGHLNEDRLRMANTPEGASLIENPLSGAPGFRMENVFVMAGVPSVMRAMFEATAHTLSGSAPLLSRTIVAELPEGTLAAGLRAVQEGYPEVEIGSYPFQRDGRFGARLVLRATEPARLQAAAGAVETLVRDLGAEPGVEGEG
jgi:molybdenum cofactor synthesis domain-containing protein